MALVKLRKKDDPLEREVEKDVDDAGLSPMSPPEAYAPPGDDQGVAYEKLHPFLQSFRDDHDGLKKVIDDFEATLPHMARTGSTNAVSAELRAFYSALEEEVFPHNRREELTLFPLLNRRLLENGEHSKATPPMTACDVLTREHIQMVQVSASSLNSFALASRLPDEKSRQVTFETALAQAGELVKLLRLHIYREDHIVFSLAHKHISTEEFDRLVD